MRSQPQRTKDGTGELSAGPRARVGARVHKWEREAKKMEAEIRRPTAWRLTFFLTCFFFAKLQPSLSFSLSLPLARALFHSLSPPSAAVKKSQ